MCACVRIDVRARQAAIARRVAVRSSCREGSRRYRKGRNGCRRYLSREANNFAAEEMNAMGAKGLGGKHKNEKTEGSSSPRNSFQDPQRDVVYRSDRSGARVSRTVQEKQPEFFSPFSSFFFFVVTGCLRYRTTEPAFRLAHPIGGMAVRQRASRAAIP